MSVVTNAILHYPLDAEEFLSRVNTFFPPFPFIGMAAAKLSSVVSH
jgi:hypothetical protein